MRGNITSIDGAWAALAVAGLVVAGAVGFLTVRGGGGAGRTALAQVTTKAGRNMTEPDDAEMEPLRLRMVKEQIEGRGVADPATLAAMRAVPRHKFMPPEVRAMAYEDGAYPIGEGQTISQPYIVGLMTSLIRPKPSMRVLEIGTGSGYQAAVLARCVAEVYTIENHPTLGRRAEETLKSLGFDKVHVRIGDGFDGWPEHAPFDAIVVTAAPRRIPQPLVDQLRVGGKLVIPLGKEWQELIIVTKTETGVTTEKVVPVLFVPMTGKAEHDRAP
jgi:protein-L-isoaspartate(D-aspartate) O-methyltransferase